MLGSWGRSFREVGANRAGFFAGGTGKGRSLRTIALPSCASGSLWVGVVSSDDGDAENDVSSTVGLSWSFGVGLLGSVVRLNSNVRGVGTSIIGEGMESLTPAAPMREGRSWRMNGSTGVSLPSDWIVRRVSDDLLNWICDAPLIRISRSRVGDKTSSTSSLLNNRTVSRSLALTDHFDLCFWTTGRSVLPFRDFWDFCLVVLDTEADRVGDFSGERAGLDNLFLRIDCLSGAGLFRTGAAGASLVGGGVMEVAWCRRLSNPGCSSACGSFPTRSKASLASRIICWAFSNCPIRSPFGI